MKFTGHPPEIATGEDKRQLLDRLIQELEAVEERKRQILVEIAKLSEG